ncbi:uncharacterized protein LOC109601110 isoform X2 [Aethina tumida]|uniref:uncharacterized protein LOC109601110 isoform X2 n=1 Tax=Aethina tumida TaxID=116153 RepID=UPI0021479AD8|nr:uncharacterized protein LOC109601110 isoform X2 [Aethina tumida]
MFVKPSIILVLVAQCLCYKWNEEGQYFNRVCQKINTAYQQSKLSYTQIDSRMDICLNAHVNEGSMKSYVMRAMTDKNYNTNSAYNNTFRQASCNVDSFHNYIYCMEGLFR